MKETRTLGSKREQEARRLAAGRLLLKGKKNVDTSLVIPFLHALHDRFRCRVVLVGDNLPAHYKTAKYFSIKHPSWFRFEDLPPYCPELNPVEGADNAFRSGRSSAAEGRHFSDLPNLFKAAVGEKLVIPSVLSKNARRPEASETASKASLPARRFRCNSYPRYPRR